MSWRSALRALLVIFVVFVVQDTLMVALRIDGAHPDLVWLLPVTAAIIGGPETGAIVGFVAGIAFDLVLPTPFGLSALVGTLVGYTIGVSTDAMDRRAVWLRPLAALIGSVGGDMLFAVLGAVLGQQQLVHVNVVAVFAVVAVSAVVLVLPVNRMMRWALSPSTGRLTLVPAHGPEGGLW